MKNNLFWTALLALALVSCRGDGPGVDIKSEADLAGRKIVTVAGSYYDGKYSAQEGVDMLRVNTEADGLMAVRQGLADAFVIDEVMFNQETLDQMGLEKACSGEERFPCAFAFPKGDDELLPAFNEFLAQMRQDGSLDAHAAHWIEGGPELPQQEENAVKRSGEPIRYLIVLTTAPICFLKDGGWTGLDVDLMRRFAAWYGRPLQVSDVPIGSAMIALQTGKADVMSGCLFPTEERRQHVTFSDPYYYCRPGIFVRSGATVARKPLWERVKNSFHQSFVAEGRWKLIVNGLLMTIAITLLSILLGTLLGIGFCAMLLSRRKWLRGCAEGYSAFMQGIPTLVLLLIMFYVVFASANVTGSFVAVVTFALFFASSSGTVFASSIQAVPRGQWEAGYALGFTKFGTFRHVVYPQALKIGFGPYVSHCISLLKGTSIVGYIAVQDLTRASDLLRSQTYEAFMPLLAITVVYFLLAWLLRLMLNLAMPKK